MKILPAPKKLEFASTVDLLTFLNLVNHKQSHRSRCSKKRIKKIQSFSQSTRKIWKTACKKSNSSNTITIHNIRKPHVGWGVLTNKSCQSDKNVQNYPKWPIMYLILECGLVDTIPHFDNLALPHLRPHLTTIPHLQTHYTNRPPHPLNTFIIQLL